MTDEITAEALARKAAEMEGLMVADGRDAAIFLALTRAYAALQAQPTEAPGRVRCWMLINHRGVPTVILDIDEANKWARDGYPVTPGHFTPDTEAHE